MSLLVAGLAVALAALTALVRTVRSDGYGRRPPPPSHRAWHEGLSPFLSGR